MKDISWSTNDPSGWTALKSEANADVSRLRRKWNSLQYAKYNDIELRWATETHNIHLYINPYRSFMFRKAQTFRVN